MVNGYSINQIIKDFSKIAGSERNVARLIAFTKNEEYSNEWYLNNIKNSLNINQYELFKTCINRLQKNEPLQYITQHQYFWKHNYYVNPNVLIPRYDSEILIEYASV